MAQTLFISEHSLLQYVSGHPSPVVEMPPITTQAIGVSGVHAESSAFQNNTRIVRLHLDGGAAGAATTGACVRFGTNPTAVTTDPRLAAEQTEYFYVNQGLNANKVSVVSSVN